MKRWSLSIGTYGGTEVRIHITFLMLLAFFAWEAMRRGGVSAAVEVLVFLIAMFTCVLLHEFGHVIAARRYGIRTPDITLLPIGGLARLERMPREPVQELIVAIAGPAVNVVIGLVLLTIHGLMPFDDFIQELFPMDGGRVLRAVLAMFLDYGQATRVAATLGQSLAVIGAMIALLSPGVNLLPLLIALFIFMAAGQEAAYVTDQESMRGLRVRDAMVTNFRTLPHDAILRDAVQLLLSGTQHDFPVLDESGEFKGMLGRTALISALAEHGAQHAVGSVTEPCETNLDPRHPLNEALEKLRASSCPALPVIDPLSGELLGLLTTENIAEMIMVRTALAR
jgi:Zn-dependent protease